MKETSTYTEYHPKWYRARVPSNWWTRQWSYLKFMLREISSIYVAYFVVVILLEIHALSRGPEAYAHFQERLKTPFLIAVNAISFFFVLLHAITWFNVSPQAIVVRVRGKRIPNLLIVASNYVAWLAISALVATLVLRR